MRFGIICGHYNGGYYILAKLVSVEVWQRSVVFIESQARVWSFETTNNSGLDETCLLYIPF